ncbi:MAG: Uma2 family endonuclease [bacterium]|jgi:Uma2 family endonuclease|nr:Uma2 family endonuclease [bacterium]
MPAQVCKRLFTVDEYYKMAESGILRTEDRVELIEGEVLEMAAIGNRHAHCVRTLIRVFSTHVGEQGILDVQNPVRLGLYSEPQPDVILLRYRPDFYAEAHPGPEDVLLLIEVADSTADFDRHVKMPLYARHGIPELWIVDLEAEIVEIYRNPRANRYAKQTRSVPGDTLISPQFPLCRIEVRALLGR